MAVARLGVIGGPRLTGCAQPTGGPGVPGSRPRVYDHSDTGPTAVPLGLATGPESHHSPRSTIGTTAPQVDSRTPAGGRLVIEPGHISESAQSRAVRPDDDCDDGSWP